jgi:hypothetical protein
MKRRNFIVLSVLTAATVSSPFTSCNTTDPELDKTLAVPQTLSLLLDAKSIKDIGKSYGKAYPDSYSKRTLEKQLKENNGNTFSSKTSAKDLYSIIGKNIQKDFQTGNTLVLNGWILSATEAWQCAMFSLM